MTQVSVGYIIPADHMDVHAEIASQTLECYHQFGGGDFDPLWGVDPPNPRVCSIVKAGVEAPHTINLKDTVILGSAAYSKSWDLGEQKPNIFLFCRDVSTPDIKRQSLERYGNDITTWGDCKFKKATIFVMYLDKHPYDWFSYGTSICRDPLGDKMTYGDFKDIDGDAIVWCVEIEER